MSKEYARKYKANRPKADLHGYQGYSITLSSSWKLMLFRLLLLIIDPHLSQEFLCGVVAVGIAYSAQGECFDERGTKQFADECAELCLF